MKANLHILKLSTIICFISITAFAQGEKKINLSDLPSHPRILLLEGEEAGIMKTIKSDFIWETTHKFILDKCDKIIEQAPVERILTGRRLLGKSREALRRIFFLSYGWRMTSEEKYFERAEKELLAVSSFSDWNPSHFLDVAEMTMAVSIGYDWLFEKLSTDSRKIIKDAIIEQGLNPSLNPKYNHWLNSTHNWNQVCNAGMTYGALAIAEDNPDLAAKIIERAIVSIKLPMEDYNPDGAYPEGYTYWGYGTSFNIMFLSSMETAFGKESGPAVPPGFYKTAEYLLHMTGPTGNAFNYSDSGPAGRMHPAMFWFANRLDDPSLLWSERYHMINKIPPNDRLLPAVMIWSTGLKMEKITPPHESTWIGHGKNPVAFMRTSWTDPDAIYVAIKGGSPSVNHGHMDIGSFIMEANGERWAMDFGAQDYNSLESAGVKLWGMAQNSQRWDVFRYNNFVHNTLTVNNQLQVVTGDAEIISSSDKPSMLNAVTEITPVYQGLLKKAVRGISIIDNRYVTVRDEIETLPSETIVRWDMLTSASVSITGKNSAVLTKNGKTLTIKIQEPSDILIKTWSTIPTHTYDAPNPGTIMVGFELKVPANTKTALTVLLLPEGAIENDKVSTTDLADWPDKSGNK